MKALFFGLFLLFGYIAVTSTSMLGIAGGMILAIVCLCVVLSK